MDFDDEKDFLYSETPINEETNKAVRKFTDDIVQSAKKKNKKVEIDVVYEEALRMDNEEKSIKSIITTKYGVIHVLPDFKNNSSRAIILNRGLIYTMELEGYSTEEINEAKIYGEPFENEFDNIETIGWYLTTDLGMQHQKGWMESI